MDDQKAVFEAARQLVRAAGLGSGDYGAVTIAVVDGEVKDVRLERRLRETDLPPRAGPSS